MSGWGALRQAQGERNREARLRCFGGVGGGPPSTGSGRTDARRDYGALGVWVAGPFDRLRANGIARRAYGALGVWVAGLLRQAQGERNREARLRCLGGVGGGPFDRLRANGIARRDYDALGFGWGALRQAQGERNHEARLRCFGGVGGGPPSTGSGRTDAGRRLEGLGVVGIAHTPLCALGVRVALPPSTSSGRTDARRRLREAEERLPIHIGRIRCARPRVRRYIRVQGY